MSTYEVVYLSPNSIHPYYRNPKVHGKQQIAAIARSIRDFGFDQPIVVDEDKTIIKGHGRYFASLSLKLMEVPVIVRTDLSTAQVIASRIADNRLFAMTAIDYDIHEQELASLQQDMSTQEATAALDFVETPATFGEQTMAAQEEIELIDEEATPAEQETQAQPVFNAETVDEGTLLSCPQCQYTFFVGKE
jgi:ParB-like chromosome segregation protein Spo0J